MDRRSVLKSTGAAAGASLFATTGAAADTISIDSELDTGAEDLQGALVVFEPGADYDVLGRFDLPEGTYEMAALDIVYTKATGPVLRKVAALDQVRYIEANREIDYHNGDAQVATEAGTVQEQFDLGYTGDGVHVAVIDSGVDAYHPDLVNRLRHNYQFQNPLSSDTAWTDIGIADTDDIGHGTHCSGSVVGEGNRDPEHEGMAPDADLTVYSTGATLLILNAVAAYNHLLENHAPGVAEGDEVIRVTSNSYGGAGGNDFNPAGAQETATWRAFDAGITVVSSAGNSGPGPNTLGGAKTAPHILCVAASHDGQGEGIDATTKPTSFSSRGRTADYDAGEGARWNEYEDPDGSGFVAMDRPTALKNVRAFHEGSDDSGSGGSRPEYESNTQTVTVGPGTDAGGVAGAPGAGSSTYVDVTPTDGRTTFLDLAVTWTPNQQDLDLYLHKGDTSSAESAANNEAVASSTSGSPGERIQTSIDSDATYTLEINPWANVASQADVTVSEKGPLPNTDGDPGPYGVYRPSVIAPGSAVVSTMGASALKALEASYGATPDQTGVLYSALSGTSMSCPVTSGVVCQVIEAYYRNNGGEYPDPIEVIKCIEGSADPNAEAAYTPYNAGAGLVNAVRAVTFAENGAAFEDGSEIQFSDINLSSVSQPEFLSASGSRQDDGQVFTAGQTNQVDITISDVSHDVSGAKEVLPDGWEVVATGDGVRKESDTTVSFTPSAVNAANGDGSASFTYFVEAPASSNSYTLGPVEVKSSETADDWVTVSGTTSTEYVAGQSTNF